MTTWVRVLAGLALAGFVTLVVAGDLTGQVVGVSDGDTLSVLVTGKRAVRVRLAEIDAPERLQAFGRRSKQSLASLCFGKIARVAVSDVDRYGRIVGRVSCAGTDANAEQIRRGMAWVYRRSSHDPTLLALEEEARRERRGLWSSPNPVPPWEFRRGGANLVPRRFLNERN